MLKINLKYVIIKLILCEEYVKYMKRNHLAKVIISVILALFCWTFTALNKELFEVFTTEEEFRLGYFILAFVSSAAICALGTIKVELKKIPALIVGILVYIISVFGAMEISVLFSDGFFSTPYIYFINILIYLFFAGAGLFVTGRLRASAITALAVSYIFNMISLIIYSFRGSSLMPTDIFAMRTAMNVASQYEFKFLPQMITGTITAIALFMLAFKFPIRLKFRFKWLTMRIAAAALMAAVAFYITGSDFSKFDVSVFDQYYANLTYGSAFSFYVNTVKMGLQKRDGYNPEELDKKLASYTPEAEPEKKPNIIVIMNESFSDLKKVGDFDTNKDYMPFFNSLKRNVIKGELFVSPFGGYTCNSEYELLTGMTTGVLQARSAPYLQMMFKKLPYSLNTHLKGMGYKARAIHPYYADGWNRNNVYKYLDFDEFVSLENFTDYTEYPEYIRNFVSDKSSYDAVLNMLYEKDDNKPDFIFNITMQNHGGYSDMSFKREIFLENMKGSYPETEQFLTLIKKSDDALRYLINELKDFKEPTVVAMFGDHLPNVERGFYEELYGKSLDNLSAEEASRRYFVPFMVWANFDIETNTNVHSSPCYLSNIIMEAAKLPKSRVQMYLDELEKEVPQVNPMGYYDAGGYWHLHGENETLDKYYDLQYALLKGEKLAYDFDYKPQGPVMFGKYEMRPTFYEYKPKAGNEPEKKKK